MRCNFVVQDAVPAKDKSRKKGVSDKLYVPQERRPALRSTALLLILIMFSFSLGAETVWQQGFESSSNDTWDFTPIPDPKPNRAVWWGPTDQALGGADAYSGDWYWGSWNLQNESHALEFDSVQLSPGYLYTLDFYYFTKELDPATEYSRYCLEYDNGFTWTNWQSLQPDTNAWTCLSVELPAQASTVRLRVEALYNGLSKYAHWDAFSVQRRPALPTAPIVQNVSALQRDDGSKIVDIHYDIFDANNDLATISLLLSENSGGSFDYQPNSANLVGDMGDSIASGIAKHIIWNAGAEGIDFDDSTYRIRVLADDHTTMGIVASPVFTPVGGTIYANQQITISCDTPSASIYYSIDGSDPDESSLLYSGFIVLDSDATLKARAYKELWTPSEISTEEYIFIPIPENFVLVEGGSFNNGTSQVTVSSFYMDKYQLTQESYRLVLGSNPASDYGVGAGYPVYYVTWYDAIEYCNRRSIQEGLTPCYSYGGLGSQPENWPNGWDTIDSNHYNLSCDWAANGYRMPTEMEWMFAARGGNLTHNYTYSGSNNLDLVGWYEGNNDPFGTKPVGSKAPNELGIYDMSGNLWELVWDIHGPYPSSPQINPTGAVSGTGRMSRGGNWLYQASYCSVSFRNFSYPTDSYRNLGFRVCRTGL